jgi:hypothetical protein
VQIVDRRDTREIIRWRCTDTELLAKSGSQPAPIIVSQTTIEEGEDSEGIDLSKKEAATIGPLILQRRYRKAIGPQPFEQSNELHLLALPQEQCVGQLLIKGNPCEMCLHVISFSRPQRNHSNVIESLDRKKSLDNGCYKISGV